MTVQQFLTITSSTPPPALRQAMAAALAVEPTHQQDAFSRFYDRVLDELDLAGEPHSGRRRHRPGLGAASWLPKWPVAKGRQPWVDICFPGPYSEP